MLAQEDKKKVVQFILDQNFFFYIEQLMQFSAIVISFFHPDLLLNIWVPSLFQFFRTALRCQIFLQTFFIFVFPPNLLGTIDLFRK